MTNIEKIYMATDILSLPCRSEFSHGLSGTDIAYLVFDNGEDILKQSCHTMGRGIEECLEELYQEMIQTLVYNINNFNGEIIINKKEIK